MRVYLENYISSKHVPTELPRRMLADPLLLQTSTPGAGVLCAFSPPYIYFLASVELLV